MKNQITIKEIKEFNNQFNSNKNNKQIMEGINNNGLQNYCLNKKIIEENPPLFNIELCETKRMDQKESLRCWIYSGLNFIKRNIANNLNTDILNFELSPTFVAFYDRLEKSNSLYNKIIHKKIDFKTINNQSYYNEPCHERGRFEGFRFIINKYGLVPYNIMEDTNDSLYSNDFTRVFNQKVKKDCFKILKAKENGLDCYKLKEKLLAENYDLLCKILGEPPLTFDYTYTNNMNEKITLNNITPLEFKEKFLNIDLNEYISITNLESNNRDLFKKYINKNSSTEFINLPINRLKELCIMQLEQGEPVIFDCNPLSFRDISTGVLDTRLYNYNSNFSFDNMTKIESLNFKERFAQHVMTFTGVHIEKNKPIRWKVEDSYGSEKRYNGYYIMNDNFFDDYIIRIVINKKFLSEAEIELYNSTSIPVSDSDAFEIK
ncbi:MAG: hypothetical protein IJN50_02385 [Clostridia bacterium]|nr:hypothetical protein [Clostridia bacterium]